MREQVTIDVDRTRGSRHVRVRVYVAPHPGEAGCAYTAGTVALAGEQTLGAAAAMLLADVVIATLKAEARRVRSGDGGSASAGIEEELPF